MNVNVVFGSLCSVSFLARFSYALARNPVLPLFAVFLGAGPEAVGLAVGISTVTGIFLKLPAGSLSYQFDVIHRVLIELMQEVSHEKPCSDCTVDV